MMNTVKSYRPRAVRSGNPPSFQLTTRDVEIIRHVSRYRFLKSDHIKRLVPGSPKNINNRLKGLFEHWFLDRPECQFETYRMGGGTSPLVYALADKGARVLMNEHGGKRMSWTHKNKSANRPFLQHTLATADFAVSLRLAVAGRDDVELIENIELVENFPATTRALNKPYRLNVPVIRQSARMDIGVEPDYAFALYLPKVKRRAFFLVEIDQGSMPVVRKNLNQSSILRKILAYQTMWKSKRHNQHFGWRNFRVLFVTTNPERVKNMIACANNHALTKGSPLFLFADKAGLYEKESLLAKPFLNCNSNELHLIPMLRKSDTSQFYF